MGRQLCILRTALTNSAEELGPFVGGGVGQAWISSVDMDQTMSARQLLHPCVGLFSVDVLFYRVGLFAFFSLPRALQKCLSPIIAIALSGLVIKTDSLIHVVDT